MFTIFQTLPILAQSPYPVGFNNNAIQMSLVQMPFALVLLILGPLGWPNNNKNWTDNSISDWYLPWHWDFHCFC